MRFIVKVIVNAVAFWLTTLIIGSIEPGQVFVTPYESGTLASILTYLLVAVIFGVVNGIIGNFIRIVAFPLYILTLGLISLVVNSLLLLLVSWISGLIGFGLTVQSFWWGVLAAIILGFISLILGLFARPLTAEKKRSR
jgi:putative membrane protein